MKILLRLEEIAILAIGGYFYNLSGFSWWLFALFFFAPDIGMIGYFVNTKTGAFLYNIFHHKGLAAAIIICGMALSEPIFIFSGSILLSHAAFDRILGYGLKYADSFKHTHLGWIGKTEKNQL